MSVSTAAKVERSKNRDKCVMQMDDRVFQDQGLVARVDPTARPRLHSRPQMTD